MQEFIAAQYIVTSYLPFLKQKLKGLISIEIYIHVFLILVLDDYILVDVGKVFTPKISPSSVKTNMDVQTFIDDFMEGTSLISGTNIESIGAFNTIKAPKKNVSITKFKEHLENNKDWSEWKFSVQIKVTEEIEEESKDQDYLQKFRRFSKSKKPKKLKIIEKPKIIAAEINLIHAAVIKQDIEKVKAIVKIAKNEKLDLKELLKSEIECIDCEKVKLTQKTSWILSATVIHLAAHWHVESLAHFLQTMPELCDIPTSESNYTPLHVAASIKDGMDAINLLIEREANTEAKDKTGQTPLHNAAQCESINNIVALLEGYANITALDDSKSSTFHKAKTSKIFDILLSQANAKMLTDLNGMLDEGDYLFTHILKKQPESIETYLDMMVTCNNPDSDIKDKQLTFHMEMFNHGTSKNENYLDKHNKVIKEDHLEILRHPVMMLFTSLKWYSHKKWYYTNFFLFFVFLISFTLHGIYWIDHLQCWKERSELKIVDAPSCDGELLKTIKNKRVPAVIAN